MTHEPMEDAIRTATQLVQEEGYLHADPISIQLAVSGYMVRELKAAITEGFENGHPKKTGVPKMVEKARVPGLVAGLVAMIEGIRSFLL